MQATQMLNQAVRGTPDGVATLSGGRSRTWRDVGERVPRIAGALRRLGLARSDRISVLAMNSDSYLELFFAVPWAGGSLVPLNIRWSLAENEYAIKDAGASILCFDESYKAQAIELRARCPGLQLAWIGAGDAPEGIADLDALADGSAPVPDSCVKDDELYVVFYTGGTTGHPKGVALSHRAIVYSSICYLAMLPSIESLRFLYVGGFFHFSGASPLWYITLAGGTHVILPKFEVEPVMQSVGEHQVTNATLIPTMVNMMMNHPDFSKYDLTSMKTCIYGGAPMPETLMLQAMEKLPTWHFYQIYGMTESGGFATMLRWRDHHQRPGQGSKLRSAGQPAIGVDVRIIRADGSTAPNGEVGEIAVRSDALMTGYYANPEATRAVLVDGWMHTGDGGRMDEDGYLFIEDRIKDMIVSGGENVYSVEVERVLYAHPAVREAAVVGIPHERWGEAVHAVVVLKQGAAASSDELIAHCRLSIGGYKCPRSIEFRSEPLPTTHVGKIRKNVLRAPYWVGHDRKI
ncbi:MAG: long-chain fatty acid--CoA ligase [Pseudomonadota bacterium]